MLDWGHIAAKRYIPPYIPPTNPNNHLDTQNFDETFLDMEPVIDDDDLNASNIDPERAAIADEAIRDAECNNEDLFDKYSYRRLNEDGHSVMYEEEHEEVSNENENANDEGEIVEKLETVANINDVDNEAMIKQPHEAEVRSEPTVKPTAPPPVPEKVAESESVVTHHPNGLRKRRREKSGVLAFDRPMLVSSSSSSSIADDEDATDDNDDDEWDLVESDTPMAPNGRRINPSTLFARGVTDRYKLILRRQNSTINNNSNRQVKVPVQSQGDASSATTDTDSPPSTRRESTPPAKKSVGEAISSTLNLRKKRGLLSKSRPTSPNKNQSLRPRPNRTPTTPSKLEKAISDGEYQSSVNTDNDENVDKTLKSTTKERKDLFSLFRSSN